MAPEGGSAPPTSRVTAARSTAELLGNEKKWLRAEVLPLESSVSETAVLLLHQPGMLVGKAGFAPATVVM